MAIKTTCPTCAKTYSLPYDLAGKTSKCVSCGETLRVPEGEKKAEQASDTPKPKSLTKQPVSLGPWVNLRRVRAGVAALFVGVFGVHKFFLRQYIKAIIFLAATLILSVFTIVSNDWRIAYYGIGIIELIGFVEGMTLLIMSDEAFVYCYGNRVAKK